MATAETVLTNALLVLPDALVPGTVLLRGGSIAEAQPGRSGFPSAEVRQVWRAGERVS